jgi:alkylhydroperoxidase/carboxymuconolactone decarboxylase family protein YurZ
MRRSPSRGRIGADDVFRPLPANAAPMSDREEILRRLTLGDDSCLESLMAARRSTASARLLGPGQETLLKIGALAASDASGLTWHQTISAALDAGIEPDQIIDALVVLAPLVGSHRVTAIAPKIALALDYDVDAALESMDLRPGPA